MRFPLVFKRRKGGSGPVPVLGADPDPLASTFPPGAVNVGNMFQTRMEGMTSSDMSSVIVGYKGPAGAIALNVSVYAWEEGTEKWFLCSSGTVPPDGFSYFKIPNLLAAAPLALRDSNVVGTTQYFIRVTDPGAAPAGEHVIYVGGDQAGH